MLPSPDAPLAPHAQTALEQLMAEADFDAPDEDLSRLLVAMEKAYRLGHAHAHARESAPPAWREGDPAWRIGQKLGRTLYHFGKVVGLVDTAALAAELIEATAAMEERGRQCEAIGPSGVRCTKPAGHVDEERVPTHDERTSGRLATCRLCLDPCRFFILDSVEGRHLPGYCARHGQDMLRPLTTPVAAPSEALTEEDKAELARPIEEVDEELRGMGLDPEKVGAEGLAFVEKLKAKRVRDAEPSILDNFPGCICSCARCGPANAHDCGRPACTREVPPPLGDAKCQVCGAVDEATKASEFDRAKYGSAFLGMPVPLCFKHRGGAHRPDEVAMLIEASSLGTPEAKAARESAPQDVVDRVLARADELQRASEADAIDFARYLIGKPRTNEARCPWSHRIGYDCELSDGHEGPHQATDLDGKSRVGWEPGRVGEYRRDVPRPDNPQTDAVNCAGLASKWLWSCGLNENEFINSLTSTLDEACRRATTLAQRAETAEVSSALRFIIAECASGLEPTVSAEGCLRSIRKKVWETLAALRDAR